MTGVELEIVPGPSPDERAAIEAALVQLLDGEAAPPNAWWQAGVLEAVASDEPDAA